MILKRKIKFHLINSFITLSYVSHYDKEFPQGVVPESWKRNHSKDFLFPDEVRFSIFDKMYRWINLSLEEKLFEFLRIKIKIYQQLKK